MELRLYDREIPRWSCLSYIDEVQKRNKKEIYTNHLNNEKSKYLLEHAHDPVDWYPWGKQAIDLAVKENKLIFLTVGYATSHWCHVMTYESFENDEIAEYMNSNFVNINVDRDERPDIDKIYMMALLLLTGEDGWPISIWLTPKLVPIAGGTYFPPKDQYGVTSFFTKLKSVHEKWLSSPKELLETGETVMRSIVNIYYSKPTDYFNDESVGDKIDAAIDLYKKEFDKECGGFGLRPKFPEVTRINLLIDLFGVTKDPEILYMALYTLQKIANGGIHDHMIGGFHRYSKDREWHVPHFEKLLCDQGQLMQIYATAYTLTQDDFYLDVADKIFEYLMSVLRTQWGGFYAGQDSHSLPKDGGLKMEGIYYAWYKSEIKEAIYYNSNQFAKDPEIVFLLYCHHYDIQEIGNIAPSSDPFGYLCNRNILIVRESLQETAQCFDLPENEVKVILNKCNEVLLNFRSRRPPPDIDPKMVTGWNGIILSGLSKLAGCNSNKKYLYLAIAKKLIKYLEQYTYDAENGFLVRARHGKGTQYSYLHGASEASEGFLDDYAFVIKGLIDYYKISLNFNILEWAKTLQEIQDKFFWDEELGGYFYSQPDPHTLIRVKDDHDDVLPCGNSVSARNLVVLSVYFENEQFYNRALRLFDFYKDLSRFGYVLPEMMSAYLIKELGFDLTGEVPRKNRITKTDDNQLTMKILNLQLEYDFVQTQTQPDGNSTTKAITHNNKFEALQ